MRCSSVAQSSTAASGWASPIAATSLARFFFERRLGVWIGVVMTRAGTLGTHADPLQVIVAALGSDVIPAGLGGDPAGDVGSGPEATAGCRSLHGLSQFLLLLGGQQGWSLRRNKFQAVVTQTRGTVSVIAPDDTTGVVFLQTDQRGCILGSLPVSDERQELPAPGFHVRRRMTCSLAQLCWRDMGSEVGFACHAAA
jgi:hypothetical protein